MAAGSGRDTLATSVPRAGRVPPTPIESAPGGRAGTAVLAGLVTGTAAGLVGVGGGEFRLPVLVRVLGFPIKLSASANLAIGLLTVAIGTAARWGRHAWSRDELALCGVMAAASVAGAVAGCLLRDRLQVRALKTCVCTYLVLVGLWMLYEAAAGVEHVLLAPTGTARTILGAAGGFTVAVVSGAFGVAGGELRIPMLIYLFGIPVDAAGTLSLAVSIPTVASGVVTDWHVARPPTWALRVALAMGLASIAGTVAGAALVPFVDRHLLKALLGLILVAATVRLTTAAGR